MHCGFCSPHCFGHTCSHWIIVRELSKVVRESTKKMAKSADDEENLATDHCPSFFQNSCPGSGDTEETENRDGCAVDLCLGIGLTIHALPNANQGDQVLREIQDPYNKEGWTKSLLHFPGMTNELIDNKLIGDSSTLPGKSIAPKAYRIKRQGYRLWKEGYVKVFSSSPMCKGNIACSWSSRKFMHR